MDEFCPLVFAVDSIKYFVDGISEVTEYGSYAHTDIQVRLNYIENDFPQYEPQVIRKLGQEVREQVKVKRSDNPAYGVVIPILSRWANWSESLG